MDPRDAVVVEEAMLLLQSVLDMFYIGLVTTSDNKVIIADGSNWMSLD
jgi:hypothetical protein